MPYTPLTLETTAREKKYKISTGAQGGINNLIAPEFLDTNFVQDIENYWSYRQGELEKIKQIDAIIEESDGLPITMLKQYTDTIWMLGFGTNLKYYNTVTETVTSLKTDWTSGGSFNGVTYGDFFYVCNGKDKVYVVSQELAYDTQTVNFTTGYTVTGQTSGAKGFIVKDVDGGATGTLTLINVEGTFVTGEDLHGGNGGRAKANGSLTYAIDEIVDSPRAKHLIVYNSQLYAGNTSSSSAEVVYSSQDTSITTIPFLTWTGASTPPLATDPGNYLYREGGEVKGFSILGAQLVVFYENGKNAIRLTLGQDSDGNPIQNFVVDFARKDFGGERGSITTPKGIFYTNESGLWQMLSGGNTNQPYSEQESNPFQIFGEDFIEDLDFTDSDLVFDNKRNLVFLTCSNQATFNNLVIWYSLETKSFGKIVGWNISRFMKISDEIYGASSLSTTVYKLFVDYEVDGATTRTFFKQEIPVDGLNNLHSLVRTTLKGFFHQSSNLSISFDIYDKQGKLIENYKKYTISTTGGNLILQGFNNASFNANTYGVGVFDNEQIETRCRQRTYIREFSRLIMKIEGEDNVPHKFTWIQLETALNRENNTINNLTAV